MIGDHQDTAGFWDIGLAAHLEPEEDHGGDLGEELAEVPSEGLIKSRGAFATVNVAGGG